MLRKTLFALLGASLATALSACSSTATPKTAALYAPKVVVTGARPATTVTPVIANTGTYPTFGPPITAANRQMDDVEARRLQSEMMTLTTDHNTGKIDEAEYQRQLIELNRLAAQHVSDTQTRIGN